MSCNTNELKTKAAAAGSGIGGLGSQAANAAGTAIGGVQRGLGKAATSSLRVINAVEGPKNINNLAPLAVVGAIAGDIQTAQAGAARLREYEQSLRDDDDDDDRPRRRPPTSRVPNWRNRVLNTVGALNLLKASSTAGGLSIARLSRPKNESTQTRNYFGGRTAVTVHSWKSRLSPALNAADTMPGMSVKSSYGRMLESKGKAWHAGMTIVKTSQGERAITHLRSMNSPSAHYYFSRSLTDQETAGIISGHPDFEVRRMPGFAGEVSEIESLFPVAARTKKNIIKTHLFWGDTGGSK